MDCERKFGIFENSYMGPLWITDPQYGIMNKKYGVSFSFYPQAGDFL
jgi:hypothetical protein